MGKGSNYKKAKAKLVEAATEPKTLEEGIEAAEDWLSKVYWDRMSPEGRGDCLNLLLKK